MLAQEKFAVTIRLFFIHIMMSGLYTEKNNGGSKVRRCDPLFPIETTADVD